MNFPFDGDDCQFYFSLPKHENNNIIFTKDDKATPYEGQRILNEFKIKSIKTLTTNSASKTSFVLTVQLERHYKQHIITFFLQSFLLCFLSYLTLFITIEDFSNRFMGSITTLLVLASLLGSMQQSLPKTAYFKGIDVWFDWFLANIFLIILLHIIVDYLRKTDSRIVPGHMPVIHQNVKDKSFYFNTIFKMVIVIINILFVIAYLIFSILIF